MSVDPCWMRGMFFASDCGGSEKSHQVSFRLWFCARWVQCAANSFTICVLTSAVKGNKPTQIIPSISSCYSIIKLTGIHWAIHVFEGGQWSHNRCDGWGDQPTQRQIATLFLFFLGKVCLCPRPSMFHGFCLLVNFVASCGLSFLSCCNWPVCDNSTGVKKHWTFSAVTCTAGTSRSFLLRVSKTLFSSIGR